METTKFICEFFFTNFWHWLGGLCYLVAIFPIAYIKLGKRRGKESKKGE